MKIRPLWDNVVVERDVADTMSEGGIILPDSAQEKPERGTVLAVGEGRRNEHGDRVPIDEIKAGDYVVFSSMSGNDFDFGDRRLCFIRAVDILAVEDPKHGV